MRSRRKVTHWTPKEGAKGSLGAMGEGEVTPPISPMEESGPTVPAHDKIKAAETPVPVEVAAAIPTPPSPVISPTTELPPVPSEPPLPPAEAAAATDTTPPPPVAKEEPSTPLPPPIAPIAGPSAHPAPRRPKPPTKGILKPPPPPSKPTLGGRLRDLASTVVGARQLFELEEAAAAVRGATAAPPGQGGAGVGNTLNALGGRLSAGLSRFVASRDNASTSPAGSPGGSPLPKNASLPEGGMPNGASTGGAGAAQSEKGRQKQPLKRATFMLPALSITYPISTAGEPWSVKIIEERKQIESNQRSIASSSTGASYWTSQRLVALYESACRGREERPRVGIIRSLEVVPPPPRSRHLHLVLRANDPSAAEASGGGMKVTEVPLNRHAAEALADVLSPEWGLADLKLEAGVIESEDALKPILHALLISGTLPNLSLAGNKKIRAGGWRLLAVFLKKARSLRYIDLSDTNWDKRSAEYLIQALTCSQVRSPPPPKADANEGETKVESPVDMTDRSGMPEAPEGEGKEDRAHYGSLFRPASSLRGASADDESAPAAVQTLRLDGCGLKAGVLDILAAGIRSSDVRNISLRRNRIGPLGAVALALMMKDYPDAPLFSSFTPPSTAAAPPLPSTDGGSASNAYTPYVPRHRRPTVPNGAGDEQDEGLPPIPLVVASSPGVTSRTVPDGYTPPPPPTYPLRMPSGGTSPFLDGGVFGSGGVNATPIEGRVFSEGGASMALQRSVRALDGVERIGRLLTLDLKGNDIKTGVGYIAQVLKRNRTLKVLNLSDNKIDPAGLVVIAEALKYNSTLETLDISSNACCGPSLDGVAALRTAFTVNTSLKRLFLSDTNLSSEGAIALAEFLPETKSLLHLDLTSNPLDTAGIMAISSGLKSNKLIRCLDVSIPPNNPELAELSQGILQSCIRNTELAASSLSSTKAAAKDAIWAPIKRSTLVQQVKTAEQLRADQERVSHAQSPEGLAREYAYTLKPEDIAPATESLCRGLEKWYDAAKIARKPGFHAWEPHHLPKEEYITLLERAKALRERLVDELQNSTDDTLLASLLPLTDTLATLIDRSNGFKPPPRLLLPSQIVPTFENRPPPTARYNARRHMRTTSLEISSPNFSIGDSDGESDAEELDVRKLPNSPPRAVSSVPGQPPSTPPPARGLGLGILETQMRNDEDRARDPAQSPVERTRRAWVEEEGEIFRKGTKLGVADEEEVEEHQDVSGEELKQEILETEVARSPTRRIIDVGDDEEGEKKEKDGDEE